MCLLGWSAKVRAEPLTVTLAYELDPAVEGCPSEEEIAQTVIAQLGYDPFRLVGGQRVRATIHAPAEGIEGKIEWLNQAGQPEGERVLSSPNKDCREFARGLSFALAVQIQLRATAAPAAPAAPAVIPVAEAPAPATRPAPPPTARRSHTLLGVGLVVQQGFQPELAWGARLFGALRRPAWSVELGTEATLLGERRLPDGTGFSSRTLAAKLAPCAHVGAFGFCAVGMAGALQVRGFGVDQPRTPSSFIGAVGGRVALFRPLFGWFGGMLHVEALLPFTRQTIAVNEQEAWSSDPLLLAAGLDLAAIFQ